MESYPKSLSDLCNSARCDFDATEELATRIAVLRRLEKAHRALFEVYFGFPWDDAPNEEQRAFLDPFVAMAVAAELDPDAALEACRRGTAGLACTSLLELGKAVDAATEAGALLSNLAAEGKLSLPQFGSFFTRRRQQRQTHNARGETITVPAWSQLSFRPAKELIGHLDHGTPLDAPPLVRAMAGALLFEQRFLRLEGIGELVVHQRPERVGRHPITMLPLTFPAESTVVLFEGVVPL